MIRQTLNIIALFLLFSLELHSLPQIPERLTVYRLYKRQVNTDAALDASVSADSSQGLFKRQVSTEGADPAAAGGADPAAQGGADPSAQGGADPAAAGGADPAAQGGADPAAQGGADPSAQGGADPSAGAPDEGGLFKRQLSEGTGNGEIMNDEELLKSLEKAEEVPVPDSTAAQPPVAQQNSEQGPLSQLSADSQQETQQGQQSVDQPQSPSDLTGSTDGDLGTAVATE